MENSRTLSKAKIVEQLMLEEILPEEYEITASQIREIREACEGDSYDLAIKAFCFGFYQAADFFLKDLHKGVHRSE